ncbi:hypothetical protein SAMN05444671_4732 [Flavobacterium sp. CF108]|jgi:hypothetical protein|uniref:hypothetical protein n=1 Tax=unclassified Flavobacterium TaxID=196869 RepID=UPI0008C24C8F|nr:MULTISPECIES: hypothetical protein [unclassified Flavobacterium]SEP24180.1 hypothetical protein SAMN04487978_0220 [Flavobacterium sp. fv08]SHI01578.1 hypothetical protein SAMN05444671_4732 [Flavobacterium sp. CF108]
MSKNIKSKPSYNQDVLKIIKEKHGFSYDYIRKSIRGDRVGIICDLIKAEYKRLDNEYKIVRESQANRLKKEIGSNK